MAIGTDALIGFAGTYDPVTVAGGTSAVTDQTMSASGDVVASGWTNDDDALLARMLLTWSYAAGSLNTNAGIHIYGRRLNIDGTDDEVQPTTTIRHNYLGSFDVTGLANSTTARFGTTIPLENFISSQIWEFYFFNDSGQSMTAGWVVEIQPQAPGPHP